MAEFLQQVGDEYGSVDAYPPTRGWSRTPSTR
jgi:hypothetical protein